MKTGSVLPRPLGFLSISLLGASILLAGCAETRLVLHTAKKLSNKPVAPAGTYKVGKPYRIAGVWYYPKVDYNYRETGMASWYGPKFHNRKTANGQIFDMNAISAAHRTLPMPSLVQVTNLTNGRSLKVLVNDRGPFAHGRIIDLSRRAAQLLGFERAGVARVLVEILPEESRQLARMAPGGPSFQTVAKAPPVRSLPPPPAPVKVASVPLARQPDLKPPPAPSKTALFVQAGAFVRIDLARQMERDLSTIGPTQIVEATVGNRRFYRVRLGPASSASHGDRMLDAVVRTGYPNARLVFY